jgi:hypothetical protein
VRIPVLWIPFDVSYTLEVAAAVGEDERRRNTLQRE